MRLTATRRSIHADPWNCYKNQKWRAPLPMCWPEAAKTVCQPKSSSSLSLHHAAARAAVDRCQHYCSDPAQKWWVLQGPARADGAVEVLADDPGFGQHPVRQGDLVLVHYKGQLADSGVIFDSTLGGQKYLDGGRGVLRPLAFRLSGYPQPGICAGLQEAIVGMRIGGTRTVLVPPEQGFGSSPVLAPYALVPAGSKLRYEIELLRVSARGPDELFTGMSGCSQGGAGAMADNCANIEPAEFF